MAAVLRLKRRGMRPLTHTHTYIRTRTSTRALSQIANCTNKLFACTTARLQEKQFKDEKKRIFVWACKLQCPSGSSLKRLGKTQSFRSPAPTLRMNENSDPIELAGRLHHQQLIEVGRGAKCGAQLSAPAPQKETKPAAWFQIPFTEAN